MTPARVLAQSRARKTTGPNSRVREDIDGECSCRAFEIGLLQDMVATALAANNVAAAVGRSACLTVFVVT